MRSAILAGAIFAAGSFALPVVEQRDIVIETAVETFTKVVWVKVTGPSPTATPTPTPTPAPAPAVVQNVAVKPAAVTSAPIETPEPSTTAAPVVQSPAATPEPAAPASTPDSTPASSGASGSFEQMVVDSHNTLRAAHQVGTLQYDDDLAASAQALAQRCIFEHDVTLGPASQYGQNIAMSYGTVAMHDAQTEMQNVISDAWYTEEAQKFAQLGLYGIANPIPNDFDAWGHYTQEVWKSTTHVGCAAVTCGDGYFTVCNYSPPGNYAGEFGQNVFN